MMRLAAKPVAIFVVSRVVNLTALAVSMMLTPGASFVDVLGRWDGGWYLEVARSGYPDRVPTGSGAAAQSTISFFPAFPALIRALDAVTGIGMLASAVVIVALSGAAAAVALHRLVLHLRDESTADRVVALCFFFPGTIAFSLIYPEALAMLAVVLCCLALLHDRWLLAGLAGALATATRPNTLGVVAAAAVAALAAMRSRASQRAWRTLAPLTAPVLSAAGFVGFAAYLWFRTGSATALTVSQRRGWHGGFSLRQSVVDIVDYVGRPGDTSLAVVVMSIVVATVGVISLVAARDMPLPLKAYGVVTLVIGMTTIGMRPRFVLLAFPIFLAWSDRLKGEVFGVLIGASAVLLGTYTVLMSTPGYPSP